MSDWLLYRTFWDLTVTGVALGAIYALVALGYTLVYGVLRLIMHPMIGPAGGRTQDGPGRKLERSFRRAI